MNIKNKVASAVFLLCVIAQCAYGVAFGLAGSAAVPSEAQKTPYPKRILFIGNSFTFYNGGVGQYLKALAGSANPPLQVDVTQQALPGESLGGHYRNTATLDLIRNGRWNCVVLQGYSNEPIVNRQQFFNYARLLDQEIHKGKAQTVFFMTWAYRSSPVMTEQLKDAYVAIAHELGSLVVPVGLAWQLAMQERPRLSLYSDDKHPNALGTYLNACVFYASLFGRSPVGNAYTGGLPPEESAFLQHIAWKTVEQFR